MCITLALCAFLGFSSAPSQEPGVATRESVDLILHGGLILTMVDPEPVPAPTAVAVGNGRILQVGDEETIQALEGPATTMLNLEGAVVVPGFIDGHAHLYGLGKSLAQIDLTGTVSAEDVVSRVWRAGSSLPGDIWLEGRGWDQNDWEDKKFPHRRLLDRLLPRRPVMLRRVDGHAAWVNGEALRRAGVTAQTDDPEGGKILRDENGEPTGILIDNGIDLVRLVIPETPPEEVRRRVELATEHCLRRGITGVHEAGVSLSRAELYRHLAREGDLRLRLYGMLDDDEETLADGFARGPYVSPDGMLALRAVKLYADGALGSRGALLLEDYSDDPGNRGLQVTSTQHLADVAARARQAGFQVCTHAIGDGGNRLVLDLYARELARSEGADLRWRVEHAQVLHPEDVPRFARLGVIASMQPVHCTSDMDWAGERLGAEREKGAYAWRSLLDDGARICFGTDFPVERVEPLEGLYAARTRCHPDGRPAGGWHAEQCLGGREALRLYTAGPAYAAFQEQDIGRVAPGMLADLTVLDADPTSGAAADLLQREVLLTVVDGVIRYRKPGP